MCQQGLVLSTVMDPRVHVLFAKNIFVDNIGDMAY